ncbi:MAG: hypothetical protein ACSHW4_15955 [Cellulophaga sp.]
MKTLKITLILFFMAIFFVSCSNSEDSEFYNLENREVVYVDDSKSTYEVGDILWLNMNVESKQNDDRSDKEIDIYNLTNASETFYGFSVFLIEDDNFSPVTLEQENLVEEIGKLNLSVNTVPENSELLGVAPYSEGNYKLRVGIKLEKAGNYFLANASLGLGEQMLTFNPTNGKDVQINFHTKIRNSDANGRFLFTVK